MADIPLFTGVVGSNVRPAEAPVESLNINAYLKGLQAAQYEPSVATAVSRGIQGGIENYEQQQLVQQEIEQNRLKLKNMEATQGLDAAIKQSELLKNTVQTQETLRSLKRNNDTLQRKSSINSVLSQMQSGSPEDIAGGLDILEKNFSTLARAGFDISNDEKGSKIIPDAGILADLTELPALASQTGDPALATRAQNIVSKFQDNLNNVNSSLKGNSVSLQPQQEEDVGSFEDELLGRGQQGQQAQQGQAAPTGAPALPRATTQTTTPTSSIPPTTGAPTARFQTVEERQTVQAPEQAAPTSPFEYGKPRGENVNFLKDIGESSLATQGVEEEGLKNLDEILLKHAPDALQAKVDYLARKIKAKNPEMTQNEVRKQAFAEAQNSTYTSEQEKVVQSMSDAFNDVRTDTQVGYSAMKRLQTLMKEKGIDPALGKTHTASQILTQLYAQAGSDEDRELIDDIHRQLDAVGNKAALLSVTKDLGLGQQVVNTPEEKEALLGLQLSSKNSLERNIQSLKIMDGVSQKLHDRLSIFNFYRQFQRDYGEAANASQIYDRLNSPTAVGDINGRPFVTRNVNKEPVADFISKRLGITNNADSRDSNKRTLSNAPISPSRFVGDKLDQQPVPDASLIPRSSPGGASPALIQRMIAAESSGNPNAESPKGAKGIMQLMDKTGKELWKDLGYEGEYDPFDKNKNLHMGITYLNSQLVGFNGDTRLAVAAYNAGPGTVSKAVNKAQEKTGRSDWNTVKEYLPKGVAEETVPYVEKIMGDAPGLEGVKLANATEADEGFNTLPNDTIRQRAQSALAPEGVAALAESAKIKTPAEAEGTTIGNIANMILSLNPLKASEAQAQTEEGVDVPEEDRSIKNQPSKISALALGAARTLAFGFDDELGALVRMATLHEDYDTAVGTVREIRDRVQQSNPNFYRAGEIAGIVPAIGAKTLAEGAALIGGKVAQKLGVKSAAEAVAPVAGEVVKKSLPQALKTGAKEGATYGALQGAGEAEGSVANRSKGAIRGGILGGVLGLGTSAAGEGVIKAGGKVIDSEVFQSLASKITGRASEKAPEFTKAEQFLYGRLQDYLKTNPGKADEVINDLRQDPSVARAIDSLGDVKMKQLIDSVAKSPSTSSDIIQAATRSLDETGERVQGVLEQHSDITSSTQAFDKAAQTIDDKVTELFDQRKAIAKPLYDKAQKSLAKVETIPPKGKLPEKIPGFTSGAVQKAIGIPEVRRAITAAKKEIDPDNLLPNNSLDVLQEAKSILYKESQGGRLAGSKAGDAFNQLRNAMRTESKEFAKADDAFAAATKDIDKKYTKGVETLQKFVDTKGVTDIDQFGAKLFKLDKRSIDNMMSLMNDEEKRSIKNAASAHILNQLEVKGERLADSTKAFPNFSKGKTPEKIESIFGAEEGKAINAALSKERQRSSVSNVIVGPGSHTAQLAMEKLDRLDQSSKKSLGSAIIAGGAAAAIFPTSPYVGAAAGIYSAKRGFGAIADRIKKGELKDEQKLSNELAEILITSPDKGIKFFEKVKEQLSYDKDSKARAAWDRIESNIKELSKASGKVASQLSVAGGSDFKTESRYKD